MVRAQSITLEGRHVTGRYTFCSGAIMVGLFSEFVESDMANPNPSPATRFKGQQAHAGAGHRAQPASLVGRSYRALGRRSASGAARRVMRKL
jgi:hypothetical protein